MLIPKILIFAHDASLYGASQSLLTLIEGIKNNQFAEIFVILPHKGEIEEKLKSLNINFEVIPFPRCFLRDKSINLFGRFKEIVKYNSQLNSVSPVILKTIEQFKPDLIYSNTSIISVGAYMAKKNNLPHVWHIREFGDLDYNLGYIPSRKNIVKQMHQSSSVIFVSKALQKHWLGNALNHSKVIYNGIINQSYDVIPHYPTQDKFTFGILGTFMPGKGQDIAIRAIGLLVKKYPHIMLSIYGNIFDKVYHQKLIDLIAELNIEKNIIFHSFEKNQDVLYRNLNVLLNCSLMEGFGRTIIEAMSRGIPVIANASGGPLEIIKHEENGFLYSHTPESLASYMEKLVSDPKLYKSISENGMRHALNYSITTYVDNVCVVFDKVLAKK